MKKKLLLSTLFLILTFWGWSQNVEISGVVTSSADKLALPGASVVIKGTVIGTTTDINGKYTIKARPDHVLVFSFLGMTTQEIIVPATNKTIDIVLAETATTMSEVVVVGYGTQKKSVVTGSISSVKSKEIEKIPNGRVEQTLQGRVSGVTIAANSGQPGSSSTVRVRGITTFGGGNDPLWVIDGIVVDGGAIGFLNQSDIESIEVLKDAASAAIYGTRAATGVILVTTKKGAAGKMNVNYNFFAGTSAPAKMLTLLNATQYAALRNESSVNGGGNIVFPDISKLGTGTDWQKEIFNNDARRTSHELSLSGGNDKSTFYASAGISDQQGIVATDISNYNKISLRLNSTHKISKVFTFGQTLGYTRAKSIGIGNTNSEFGGPLSSAINLDPITPVIITDPVEANKSPYSTNPVFRDANGNPYGISSIVGQEMTNPVAYMKTRLGNFDWSDDIVGNAFLEINVDSHIKIRSSVGGKKAYWGNQAFTPVSYLNANNVVTKNNFGKSINTTFNWNVENTITYSNKIADHDFSVLLGQGAYVENNGGGSSIATFDLPITNYQDASFNFNISQTNRTSGAYDYTNHKLASLFGRANYNYKEKYLFTGIIRRDGSSRFGTNNKYGVFPSFSLGWVLTNEDFWKKNAIVNTFKIRGGYGVVGNDNISDFGYLSRVLGGFNYAVGNAGIITTGYAPSSLDNPDLKWEQTAQTNIGFDARLLNDFTLTVDLYKKKTTGILRPVSIPGYVGVSDAPVANVADMENKGVEFELGYRKNIGQVNFSANTNIAYLQNKITYVASDANSIPGDASFQSMGLVTRTQVGQSYNSFFGFQTAGIFQNMSDVTAYKNAEGTLIQPNARPGDFRWVDNNGLDAAGKLTGVPDGKITDADKTFLGSNIPKFTFGLTLNADFKGFDVMVFAQGAAGNKIFQGLRRLDILTANYQTNALSRWTGEGTSNTYPILSTSDANMNFGNMSDFYLEKGDYLRLKVVQLGYTFKSNLLQKVSVTKFRLYLSAENLLTLTKYTGYDPEIGGGVFGIDKGVYPQARSFIAGVQLQF